MTLSTRLATEPPSRELDAAIARAMGMTCEPIIEGGLHFIWRGDGHRKRLMPAYTGNLQHALDVFRERLPGWQITLSLEIPHARNHQPGWHCDLDEPDDDLTLHPSYWRKAEGFHASEPQMALLAAMAQAEGW